MTFGTIVLWDKARTWATRKSETMSAIEGAGNGLRIRAKVTNRKGFCSFMLWSNQGEKGGQSFTEICNKLATAEGILVFETYSANSKGDFAPNMNLKGVHTLEEWIGLMTNAVEEEGDMEVPDILKAFVAPQRVSTATTTTATDNTADLASALQQMHKK